MGEWSTAFTLVCLRDKCLYTLSLKQVHSQLELRQMFGAPCKGDILLLEDIETPVVRREDVQAETSEKADENEIGSNDGLENVR